MGLFIFFGAMELKSLVVSKFLGLRIFGILSDISFSTYLVHSLILRYLGGTKLFTYLPSNENGALIYVGIIFVLSNFAAY